MCGRTISRSDPLERVVQENMVIDKMHPAHLVDVLRIETSSASSPWTERQFMAEFDNTFSKAYVVMFEDKVIAFAIIWFAADELQIANIAVDDKFRRCGIASFFLTTLFKRAFEQGALQAHLEVRRSNAPAIALYKKLGFTISGTRTDYYMSPVEDAVLMSANLTN